MNPILECRGLTKNYGSFTALSNLNLSLDRGQIIGLLGPNGSGKTTLIKLINGLLVPTDGRILIDGAEPSVTTRNIVSYLPEGFFLKPSSLFLSKYNLNQKHIQHRSSPDTEQIVSFPHMQCRNRGHSNQLRNTMRRLPHRCTF